MGATFRSWRYVAVPSEIPGSWCLYAVPTDGSKRVLLDHGLPRDLALKTAQRLNRPLPH